MKPHHCSPTLALLLGILGLAGLSTAHAADPLAEVIGALRIEAPNQNSCSIVANGEGTSIFTRDCGNDRSQITLDQMPSTSRILISSLDCSESVSDHQDWWVTLETTARQTSTLPLSVDAIVKKTEAWLANPADPYVAPYVRIVNGQIRKTSGQARCAAVTLPVSSPEKKKNSFLFHAEPSQEAVEQNGMYHGTCKYGVMMRIYSKDPYDFSFQCLSYIDGENNRYVPYKYSGYFYFNSDTKPLSCPKDMAIYKLRIGVSKNPSYFRCVSYKHPVTGAILHLERNNYEQRYINRNGHHMLCENRNQAGPEVLVSEPNNVITGYDIEKNTQQIQCSTYSNPSQ
ncbi:hypothetical protein [Pseudomonas sp. RIT-PI-S]|uniref:hypothetical protein n=1 Tax=Pseudomonas sp. RIT-PI-S TaxID=3035295 RepID=UPI0021DAD7F9|nr:hypothetical protein [Pseudomonas sp. RIT-PI-S]